MEIITAFRENVLRLIAIVCLFVGLLDAARLLGVSAGEVSPMTSLGAQGFIFLALFTTGRLFAAVGLWIESSWGGVILVSVTVAELVVVLFGGILSLPLIDLLVRILLLLALLSYLGVHHLRHRRASHD